MRCPFGSAPWKLSKTIWSIMRRFLLSCGLAATCLSGGFASETETMVSETVKALRANDFAKVISTVQGNLDQAKAVV